MDILSIIIKLLGSFGLFLFGMNVLSSGLQKAVSNKMQKILEMLTKNRFRGVLLGAGVTAGLYKARQQPQSW